jgi:hypothetical protein
MEKSVDGGKGGCVGPYFVVYFYSVSSYRPPHSLVPQSIHLVPLLFHHPLKVSGGFRGTHNREETLEGDQELYQLLLISKRPLLPCGPRMAREKESGCPAPSRFKSAGAEEYKGGAVVEAEAEERRA